MLLSQRTLLKALLAAGVSIVLPKPAASRGTVNLLNRFNRRLQLSQPQSLSVLASTADFVSDSALPVVVDTRLFTRTEVGSGIFGRWQIDTHGLPAYQYELDQHADRRARFANSQGFDRRDHWYPIGNDRIIGIAYNEGYVQFYIGDRGGTVINRFDDGSSPDDWIDAIKALPAAVRTFLKRLNLQKRLQEQRELLKHWQKTHPQDTNMAKLAMDIQKHMADELRTATRDAATSQHYSGGFGYIDDGEATWSTAYCYRPKEALTRRLFGMGYYETEMTHRDIRLVRRVYAPCGDDPLLISDVVISNMSAQTKTIRCYEYWDVNVYQIKASWFQTGLPAIASTDSRYAINDNFSQNVTFDSATNVLRAHMQVLIEDIPKPEEASDTDWYPADMFLVDLGGSPSAVYTDTALFFGEGGPAQPDAVSKRQEGMLRPYGSASRQPYCMVMRRDLTLAPREVMPLRYAYGTVRPGASTDFVDKYRTVSLNDTLSIWKNRLVYFSMPDEPELKREMAWHAYALQQATVYSAYFKTHVITQGSAYLYLHGLDGAPRDQALFAMPMTYMRPDLARETLLLILSVTFAKDHGLTYAFSGHGKLDSAIVHKRPSDLDLFLLMALSEYLAATGDVGFLSHQVPFYGADAAQPVATVLEHARVAFDHLINDVRIGSNGLLRVGDGDWSDAIVIETAAARLFLGVSFEESVEGGESIPNTQMALYVLPIAAAVLEPHDPTLAARMRDVLPDFKSAVDRQWAGRWYTRALLRDVLDREVVIGKEAINLEAQPWALISGAAADAGHEDKLIESIDTLLDQRAPTGATYTERGRVSAAISQLLTWGYSRSRPDLAWRSLRKQMFASHATVFPELWYGIWTAPDALNGAEIDHPGQASSSAVTPISDFPAMNSNPDAMALLALIRLCGIDPVADGLRIAPHLTPDKKEFVLDMPLIRVEVSPTGISGEYRAANDGERALYIAIPKDAIFSAATIGTTAAQPDASGHTVRLPFSFRKGDRVSFRVTWTLPPITQVGL